ncbi:MAG: 50S ribosomal protein L22 [Deltaproteobacteria bacterium]|nr:50S ribosomal protein L22 [Deltaproteobacteria bacterium]
MEVRAVAKYLRLSPFKGRLVADTIRGKNVSEALGILQFTPKKAAVAIRKVMDSAVANATAREGVDIDDLYVKTIVVDEGPTLKRMLLRSMGRANRILKRTCHVTIVLDER